MPITSLVYKAFVYVLLGPGLLAALSGLLYSPASALPFAESTNGYISGLATDEESAFSGKAEALVSTVESYLGAQNFVGASQAALEVTQLYPTYVKGWMLLGYCRSMTGDFAASNDAYGKAMELGAEPNAVYAREAYNFIRLGEYDEAKKRCRSVLESNAGDLDALRQLGYVEAKLGDLDAAALCYRKAMDLVPDDADVVIALAKVEVARGDDGKVKELLERGLLLDPDNTEVLGKLGLIHMKEKNYQAALDPLKKLASLEPENAKAFRNLGAAYYQLGNKENALGAFEKVKQLDGDMDDLLGPLADCYLAMTRQSEALAVIQEGIGKGAQRAWLYSLWGKVLEESKDYDGAIEKFSEAVRVDEAPWSAYARKQIARQSTLKKREGMMASQMQE